ncbi:MAG: phenylacetate--CoA ligase family protein [Halobacteriota archaeon]
MSPDPTTAKALSILSRYRTLSSTSKFLQKSQWWSAAEIETFQLRQLKQLLTHAYNNVPYYRSVFSEQGLQPNDIRDLTDLERLPILTKETARDNLHALKARNFSAQDLEYVGTSATTGMTLRFYYERGTSRARELAFVRSAWGRVGYRFIDKCATLRGDVISSHGTSKLDEKKLLGRLLVLSSVSMTAESLPRYIQLIRKFKPRYIWGYPSSISILAQFMLDNNVEHFLTVRAILCGSENLFEWQRRLLEEVFQCRVFSWYGQSELAAFASECEVSHLYHVFPEYGVFELVDKTDRPITQAGEVGEIVATGFNNAAVPFIRYRTGDLAQYADATCECGRHHALLRRIEGRANEFVVDRTGREVPLNAIWTNDRVFFSSDFDGVRQFQFFQDKPGEVILNIVPGKDYGKGDSAQMFAALVERLGSEMDLEVRLVNHIPRSEAGKHRWLIQKLTVRTDKQPPS